MARRKSRSNPDQPRPHRVPVSLSDDVLARLDAWRVGSGHKRAAAAAFLIERALDASKPAKTA